MKRGRITPATLDDQLCFALYAASIAMNRIYKPMLDDMGITYPQYLALNALWECDDLTVSGIAARLALDPSTVTPLVKRLEAAGFVTRRRDPDDERQVRVTLTEVGLALGVEGDCLNEAMAERTGLSVADTRALTANLHALRAALADAKAHAST
jgi:DNA-binding MarR family transcriptional regulator